VRLRNFLSVLAVAGVLAGQGADSAGGSVTRADAPEAGPLLAGSRSIWAEKTSAGGFVLRGTEPGRDAATVATFNPPRFSSLIPELSASARRLGVAVGVSSADEPWAQRDVYTFRIGEQPQALDRHCHISSADLPRAIDVSADAIIYPRCTGGGQAVYTRDYGPPVPLDQILPMAVPGGGLRLAGRYAAWLETGGGYASNRTAIDVYDRDAGSLSYRIPAENVGAGLESIDLQSDGTLAFSYQGQAHERIAWASRAEPFRHVLPLRSRDPYEVRIARNTIAFEVGRQPAAGLVARARVGVSDLSGHATLMGNLGEGSQFTDDFDFDGRSLVWWSYGCRRARINRIAVGGSPRLRPRRSGCQLRFRRAPRFEDHRHRLRLFIDCFGFDEVDRGVCSARHVTITSRHDHKRVLVAAKRRGTRLTLTEEGRALALAGPLKVRITATLVDLAGRHERRTTAAVLGGA
jgi:hypothetical protein